MTGLDCVDIDCHPPTHSLSLAITLTDSLHCLSLYLCLSTNHLSPPSSFITWHGITALPPCCAGIKVNPGSTTKKVVREKDGTLTLHLVNGEVRTHPLYTD